MSKWTVEANSDTIATIEFNYPVQFWPERTCRSVGEKFTCSKCGTNVYGGTFRHSFCDSEGRRWYTTENPPSWNYCPNCGAKVVE